MTSACPRVQGFMSRNATVCSSSSTIGAGTSPARIEQNRQSSAMDAVAYRAALGLLSETELRERVTRLAAIERGSASPGEREAAELIAAELRESGARVRLEEEPAHGTYWWPVGLLTGAAAAAAVWGRRAGAAVGLFAAAAVADDIT